MLDADDRNTRFGLKHTHGCWYLVTSVDKNSGFSIDDTLWSHMLSVLLIAVESSQVTALRSLVGLKF